MDKRQTANGWARDGSAFWTTSEFGLFGVRESWRLKARASDIRKIEDWNHRHYQNHNIQRSCYFSSRNQLLFKFPGGCFVARGCVFFSKFLRETLLGKWQLVDPTRPAPLGGHGRWAKAPPSSAMKKMKWRRFKVPTWQFCNLASFQTSSLRNCFRNDQNSHLGICKATSKRMKWNLFCIVFIDLKHYDVVLRPVCEARSREWRSFQA